MSATEYDRFILEDPAGRPLGLLLRSGKVFVFYACEPCLSRLDMHLYASVPQAARAVRQEMSASTVTQT